MEVTKEAKWLSSEIRDAYWSILKLAIRRIGLCFHFYNNFAEVNPFWQP